MTALALPGGVAAILLTSGASFTSELSATVQQTPAGAPPVGAGALGVDVADYQHRNGALIDWPQVAAAGYTFAFVKATEGGYYVNPWYAYDIAQAKAAGLYVAGYHFAIPNVSDGASQADYALQNGTARTPRAVEPCRWRSTSNTTRTARNATD